MQVALAAGGGGMRGQCAWGARNPQFATAAISFQPAADVAWEHVESKSAKRELSTRGFWSCAGLGSQSGWARTQFRLPCVKRSFMRIGASTNEFLPGLPQWTRWYWLHTQLHVLTIIWGAAWCTNQPYDLTSPAWKSIPYEFSKKMKSSSIKKKSFFFNLCETPSFVPVGFHDPAFHVKRPVRIILPPM